MIRLYEFAFSGNCHKVRLMLSLPGLPYESVPVSGANREHKSPGFLAMNPLGQVPVLTDGELVVRDSQAILVYLASRYGGPAWWPQDPAKLANLSAWLSTAANEVAHGPNALRLHYKFGREVALDEARRVTRELLSILESQLSQHGWFAGKAPGIADIALYPYIALSPEGGVDLAEYRAVGAWIARIQAMPGYVGMPGMQA